MHPSNSGRRTERLRGTVFEAPTAPSASELASDEPNWQRWAVGARIYNEPRVDQLPDVVRSVSEMMKRKAPENLHAMEEIRRDELTKAFAVFYPSNIPHLDALLGEAAFAQTVYSVPAFSSRLETLLPSIINLVVKLQRLRSLPRESGRPSEADWRQPVDGFISDVFQHIDDRGCRTKYRIALPRSSTVPSPEAVTLDSVLILSSDGWIRDDSRGTSSYIEEACCTVEWESQCIPVLLWIAEYKREALGCNKLIYGLATAQRQRIAMGFNDEVVYGVAMTDYTAHVRVAWVERSVTTPTGDEHPRIFTHLLVTLDLHNYLDAIKFAVLLLIVEADIENNRQKFLDLTCTALRNAQAGSTSTWKARAPTGRSIPDEEEEVAPYGKEEIRPAGNDGLPDVMAWVVDVHMAQPCQEVDIA